MLGTQFTITGLLPITGPIKVRRERFLVKLTITSAANKINLENNIDDQTLIKNILMVMFILTGIAAIAGSAMIATAMAESIDAPFLQVKYQLNIMTILKMASSFCSSYSKPISSYLSIPFQLRPPWKLCLEHLLPPKSCRSTLPTLSYFLP